VSNIPEYNVTFPQDKVVDKGSYKQEIEAKDKIRDYVESYNNHPRVREYGLFLTKKWYLYTIAIVAFAFFIILLIILSLINSNVSNVIDKQLNPSFPVYFEANSTIQSNTTNYFNNEYKSDHQIYNQINLSMKYDIDSDAVNDIIDGINDKICNDVIFNMTCTFLNNTYNCSYDDVYFPVNFIGYYNRTKLNGNLKEV